MKKVHTAVKIAISIDRHYKKSEELKRALLRLKLSMTRAEKDEYERRIL